MRAEHWQRSAGKGNVEFNKNVFMEMISNEIHLFRFRIALHRISISDMR